MCARDALASAVHLVAECSGIPKGSIERMYRCESVGDFFEEADEEIEGNELLEDALPENVQPIMDSEPQISTVLQQIASVAADEFEVNPDDEQQEIDRPAPPDPDAKIPNGPELIALTKDSKQHETTPASHDLPRTLRSALSSGSMWTQLWRLCIFLRCGEAGMDSLYLKKAELVRERSRKLNWHQPLGFQLVWILLF